MFEANQNKIERLFRTGSDPVEDRGISTLIVFELTMYLQFMNKDIQCRFRNIYAYVKLNLHDT